MMLTGKTERARRAKSLGLVDAVTQERHVRAAVKAAVDGELKTGRARHARHGCSTSRPARRLLATRMRSETAKKGAERALSRALRADRSLGEPWRRCAAPCRRPRSHPSRGCWSPTRREISCGCSSCAKSSRAWPTATWDGRRVHVIGAGAMGGDIAAWCAWHGFTVSLADMKPEPLAGAIKRAAELYGKIGRATAARSATRSTG